MINQIKMGLIALVGVVIWGMTPGFVHAAIPHAFVCNDCHRSAANPRLMGNLCVNCHLKSENNTVAKFNVGAASNTLAHNPSPGTGSGGETSHFWGGNSTKWAAAGSANPTTAFYASRYSISTNRITCTICHEPHGEAGTKLVRAAIAGDLICQQCHSSWFISNTPDTNATLTHPIVADYATFAAANPTDYKATVTNAGSGDVRLVNGGVSCTSCHATHYADSSSGTVDGTTTYNNLSMAQGDGNILRTDGPLRAGPDRNTAGTGTAQLRSNLCQACHTIELHGQGASGDHMLGCLDCHGGHAYNGGIPNAYILNKQTPDAVPTRINGVNSGSVQITFPNYPSGGSTRTKWADDVAVDANGFCEKCHGDVNAGVIGAKAAEHLAGDGNECTACHKHNDPANLYSFNRDASSATCGQCHGFPPYKNVPGDRVAVPANDGGYAVNNSADPGAPYDYFANTTYEKDETQTGHKVHAGADLPTSPAGAADWYFVGVAGVDNCKVCHGLSAGSGAGGHRINPTTRPETFRDVTFDGIAKTGGMSPTYTGAAPWTCSNVYCHTNGAPYTGVSRPTRNYSVVNVTPAWDQANGGGFNAIYGNANRCQFCHGNDVTSMGAGQKQNSPAHQAHIGAATTLNMGKVFDCKVCHINTAGSPTTLTAGAMDGRSGGKHVNGLIDVNFDTVDYNAELSTSTYTAASGVCSTYCHNVTGDAGAIAADWDVATDMQCDSCHGGLATDITGNGGYGPITTGSHSRHILTTGTGPKLACAECHDTNSDAGTHAGHLDGVVTMKAPVNGVTFADICQECHGYDAEAGEVLPVWGSPATTDCGTCHAGIQCGETINGKDPVPANYARTSGHNRPTSAGVYAQTANPAANLSCSGCHVTDHAGHWDGTSGDDMMLISGSGFPATYAGNENNFCGTCHGAAGTAAKKNINTHRSKLCVACHNVHGDQNIQMIWTTQADQVSHDPSVTGKYAADVFFSNATTFTAGNTNSYDEDDGAVGSAGEANSDDLCATCHTSAAGSDHNNSNNTDNKAPTGHKMGENCFPCHALHTNSTDAFKVGVGTACNDCHGFPPATGAHRKGALITDPELHSNTTQNLLAEDRTDCAFCHTGADLYTYDLTADQAAGGARANHAVSQANRRTVLAAVVGYETTNFSCTTACHKSTNGDGEWDDTNGLNCNACHYAAASPASSGNLTANNSEAVSPTHNKHFDKNNMACKECHDVVDSPTWTYIGVGGPLPHVITPDYTGAGNDGTLIQGRANATLDEATVVRTSMTYSGGVADAGGANNTCSGGIGIGCHASGSPDWDVAIPATTAGCVMCHTETTSAAYNPTSGLHNNSPSGPTVTGNAHDGSFDNGAAGTADCVTCHTASPTATVSNHVNGTLNTGAAITVAASSGYAVATADCATTCHSAGTTWRYKWSTTAYSTVGLECANCHGDYTGWNTGVAPHTENATRGNKHNNTGTLTYPCTDCHAIGSVSGYNWTSKWDPTGVNSNHGDDKITMNDTAINNFAIDTAPNPDRAGCTTNSCHQNDAAHNFRITTTAFTTQSVGGNEPSILCSSCHGGYAGTNANGYWPDDVNAVDNGTEDNSGAHQKHITALAKAKYNETLVQLLTDNTAGNPGITADVKQKFLCAYCHTNPGSDGDHGILANLPAEVNSMYALWDLTRSTPDNASFTPASGTCATSNCHSNKTTPTTPTSYTWYSGSTSACIMCHVDVTIEAKHIAHTGAATNFGRTITCDDCHKTATETVAWGSPGTPPTNNHINGALMVTGSVTFTYDGLKSCGTNACHNAGDGVTAPATASYPWNGAALANCTICHAGTPATGAHVEHVANTAYVSGSCGDCHSNSTASQITATTHIDGTKDTGGAKSVVSNANGSCTNTCHLSPEAGDWTGGPAAIACKDCHSGSGASAYIGGDKTSVAGPNYMPQYNMHTVTPVTSGKVHTDTGLGTTCQYCHDGITALSSHVDGTWATDNSNNLGGGQGRGLFTGFGDAAIPTCSGSNVDKTGVVCHIDNGTWTRKWNANAANNNETRCANCHGYWAAGADSTGWRTGVSHAEFGTRGSTSTHNDAADPLFGFECYRCHVLGGSGDVYHWANSTNDWVTDGGNTQHGDGFINMNRTQVNTNDHNISGRSGCTSCHEGAVDLPPSPNTHDFPASTFGLVELDGADNVSSGGGGCDACHGGGGSYAPNGSRGNVWPDRPGKHSEHMVALTAKGITGSDACLYCHPYPAGYSTYEVGQHNDVSAPATMPNATSNYYKRIIGGGNDTNGITNGSGSSYVTCSNVDCHFDQPVTPHWYTDDKPPATVTLTAVAGPNPRSIKVSWTAPGDDDNVADTSPYVYDLRMGTDAGTASNFGLITNYAGNLPAAYKQGSASEAIIENLTVGSTYHFALKTRDGVGNWSTASATASALPTVDTQAPSFGGANQATKGDSSATVYLAWTPAEDHTMPITYKIWRKAASAGALDMGVDTPLLTGVKAHNLVLTSADGLANDTIYNFGVRACDANNNCDTNTQIVSATPTAEPLVNSTNHTYRTNNTALQLVKDGAFGATGLSSVALSTARIFSPTANISYSVTYFADTFAIYLDAPNSGGPHTVQAEFGSYNGTTFTSLVTKTVTFGNRADRIYQFKFGGATNTFAANLRPAVRLQQTVGTGVLVNYGTATWRGDLTMAERIVNSVPTNPAVNATVSSANVNVTWTASNDIIDGLSDTIHYDLFGSDDNGTTYRYLIATGIPAATTNYSWNTQEDGISGAATVAVKLLPGDGYGHYTGAVTTKTALAVNNSADNVAPSAINDLTAKARPKSGSVQLTWTAPGDDELNNGRAKYYDIRYSTAAITEGNFAAATECVNEPSPDFGGEIQHFEVTGLTPGQNYYFAIKTSDDGSPAKVSAISTPKYPGPTPPPSDQAIGGPRCGMCHTTAPSIVESVGNHKLHGFTINDCTKCHGAAVATYGLDHQDGLLKMGYGPGGPVAGTISTTTNPNDTITYTDTSTSKVMYRDTDGYGGFGNGSYASVEDGTDDGSCINFGAMGVGGCHGSAGTDPDGVGALPTYFTPTWTDVATLNCAACHGNPNRTVDSFYGRAFDAGLTDQIKGSPVVDNRGNYNLADPDEKDRKYIGQHEKHLNYSFRFSKGDSCNLCHSGNYSDVNNLDGKHGNGDVDVKLDKVAAGSGATWTAGTTTTAGTCSNMSPDSCHPAADSPKWDSAQSFDCVGCHNMGGTLTNIGHFTDPIGGITLDTDTTNTNDGGPMLGNCTWCHFAGHPRDDVGGTSLILANSSQVGINYKSGGIHLRMSIAGRAAQATEAELCWSCHDAQTTKISEWGTDTGANNVSTRPPNSSDYNYGTVNSGTSSKWIASPGVGASWSSSVANFSYKTGAIRSTHSTSESGTSAVSGAMETYTETIDTVGNIRCSNCHDVHNLNKAPGDAMTGQPYLRGSWIRNPYPEDGAPWGKSYSVVVSLFGAVPRAGGNEQGGYQIDQNNSYPTAGMSLATSAGLCTLCHGTNVDAMDKTTSENLWIGSNGHSNATLGGTASAAANIFGNGVGGRPAASGTFSDTAGATSEVVTMGLQNFPAGAFTGRGYGYRNAQGYNTPRTPVIGASQPYAYNAFTWGVTVDASTIDIGYHAFTCSKCHNPHASRLPKLMVTNCLDSRQNTWQSSAAGQGNTAQTTWTSVDDNGEKAATWNTAQNCHRYDSVDNLGGWNKVTPW